MNYNEEIYCSFELSKLLKEKGFNWACDAYYMKNTGYNKEGDFVKSQSAYQLYNFKEGRTPVLGVCTAPTLQMANRWIHQVYNIYTLVHIGTEGISLYYYYSIGKIKTDDEFSIYYYDHKDNRRYGTPEYANEAALKYILTEIIK